MGSSWIVGKALFRSETLGAAKKAFPSCPHIYTDNWEHRSVQLARPPVHGVMTDPRSRLGIGTDGRRLRIIRSMAEPWAQTTRWRTKAGTHNGTPSLITEAMRKPGKLVRVEKHKHSLVVRHCWKQTCYVTQGREGLLWHSTLSLYTAWKKVALSKDGNRSQMLAASVAPARDCRVVKRLNLQQKCCVWCKKL